MKEEAIREAWRAARETWPDIEVTPEEFAAYVRERLPDAGGADEDAAEPAPAWQGRDLYLACACAKGDTSALYAFEKLFFPQVDAAVRRVGKAVGADEVRQVLRERLFVAEPGSPPKITEYSGRGALRTWVRIAAMRTAINLAARAARELPFEKDALTFIIGGGEDPELQYLKRRYVDEFRQAFADAFASLEDRERNLLRYAFGEGLTVDAIGTLYGVHRATAARWVAKAHASLVERLRKATLERLKVNKKEYASILRLIESQLEISFERYLRSEDPDA